MEIIEVINLLDKVKPNNYSVSDKVKWLSKLDGIIKAEIIDTHEYGEDVVFEGYTEDNLNQELIVKAPYNDVYIRWLESQIDYANGEYTKYNNTSIAFNNAYASFERYYNRTHMPKETKMKYF